MNANDVIAKLKFKVFKEFPFYADLSINKKHIINNSIETMCVVLDNDNNIVILFNENFLKSNKFEENLFAYLHELKHIALNHLFSTKKHSDRDEFLMNIAQDIIVNELTREEIKPTEKLLNSLIFKEKFKELEDVDVKKLSHIEIYDILFKKFKNVMNKLNIPNPSASFPQLCDNNNDQSDGGNGASENNNMNDVLNDFKKKFDEFSKHVDKLNEQGELTETEAEIFKKAYKDYYFKKLFDGLSEKEKQQLQQKIRDEVMSGYVQAKQRGQVTAGMEQMIEHLFKKVRDWRKVLREEVIEMIKGDWTWTKVSDTLQSLHVAGFKQIGNLPSLDDTYSIPTLFVGIDVSGSISDNEYKQFLNEIYSIFKSVNIREAEIVMWENDVTKVIPFRNGAVNKVLEELKKRKGYGGTALRSFLKYCNKKPAFNKIAVIFTDGYVEGDLKPEEFRNFKKVIFVLTRNSNYENIAKLKSPRIKVLRIMQ